MGALMLAGVPLNESILVASLAYIGKLIGAIEQHDRGVGG